MKRYSKYTIYTDFFFVSTLRILFFFFCKIIFYLKNWFWKNLMKTLNWVFYLSGMENPVEALHKAKERPRLLGYETVHQVSLDSHPTQPLCVPLHPSTLYAIEIWFKTNILFPGYLVDWNSPREKLCQHLFFFFFYFVFINLKISLVFDAWFLNWENLVKNLGFNFVFFFK